MTDTAQKPKADHQLAIDNRGRVTLSGIEEVLGYDTSAVLMKSSCGDLLLKGSDLVIKTFDQQTGRLILEGSVDALQYAAMHQEKGGFLKRLLG